MTGTVTIMATVRVATGLLGGPEMTTHERVVVSLSGGSEGEVLLRRGARVASRSEGGELIAVHVTSQDAAGGPGAASLSSQRILTERLGGSYRQIVGEDVPTALVDFARSVSASQLVIGVSRRKPAVPPGDRTRSRRDRHPPRRRHRRPHRQPHRHAAADPDCPASPAR